MGKGWGRGAELNLKPLFTTWREKKIPDCLSDCLIQCCDQNTSVHNITGKTVIPTNRPPPDDIQGFAVWYFIGEQTFFFFFSLHKIRILRV